MSDHDEPLTASLISPLEDGGDGHDIDGGREEGRSYGRLGAALLVVVTVVALVLVVDQPDSESASPAVPPAPTAFDDPENDSTRIGDGPVFAEPVGLVAAIGEVGSDIHLLDLDTGAVTALGRTGSPQLIDDGRLIVRGESGRWEVVDLAVGDLGPDAAGADGDADAIGSTEGGELYSSAVPAEAGGVWLQGDGVEGGQGVWSRIDAESGDVVQRVTLPEGASVVADDGGLPLAGPEVVGTTGRGIFALGADGRYEHVYDGRLIAFSERLLLVSGCVLGACVNRWLDRNSLKELDTPAPDTQLAGAFIRNDRLLVAETPGGAGWIVKVFDIGTGRAIATGSPSGLARTWVSPSGRFIAVPGFNALLVTDLDGNVTVAIDRLSLGPDVRLAWGRT